MASVILQNRTDRVVDEPIFLGKGAKMRILHAIQPIPGADPKYTVAVGVKRQDELADEPVFFAEASALTPVKGIQSVTAGAQPDVTGFVLSDTPRVNPRQMYRELCDDGLIVD